MDVRSRDYQISWMCGLPHFLTHGAPLKDLWILRRGRLREQDFHSTFSKVVREGESGSFWPEKVENENVVVAETSFIKCQKFCLFCDRERAML